MNNKEAHISKKEQIERQERLKRLKEEHAGILDRLFDDPGNYKLINRLNSLEVSIGSITGDCVLETTTDLK